MSHSIQRVEQTVNTKCFRLRGILLALRIFENHIIYKLNDSIRQIVRRLI